MTDFYYEGVRRMDWGLGTPNVAATLLSLVMIAAWGLAEIRRWGFWLALDLSTGAGIFLAQTMSRGGMCAAVVGMLFLLACSLTGQSVLVGNPLFGPVHLLPSGVSVEHIWVRMGEFARQVNTLPWEAAM